MSALGPISAALEAELRKQVQQNGIVIWLDRDGHYSQLVAELQAQRTDGELPYAVHGFRGSHLALMLELDAVAAGSDPPRLLIHLPGFTEDTVKETPLLGLYRSGVRYRKALDTLIREATNNRRSLDDFARGFFGRLDGRVERRGYTFDEVVAALNAVHPHDWAGFLRDRLDAAGALSGLSGRVYATQTEAWRALTPSAT
jgi:hypothetical protein